MTKLALFVLIPLMLLAVSGVVIVDVRESGPGGARIWVPVPLALGQFGLAFAPAEARCVDLEKAEEWFPVAASVVGELKEQPDFTLVDVRDGESHVVVRKDGANLVVEVDDGPDQQVRCRLPLKTAEKILAGCRDGELRTADVLRAVQFMPGGQLVHVRDGNDEVRITKL